MKASDMAFRIAVCLGLIGMTGGVLMAASHNHDLHPAHAHLNLLGWVSLFLLGGFYRMNPSLDTRRGAKWQVLAWSFGTIVLATGVAAIYAGYPQAEPLAAIGSIIVVACMVWFAYFVFRPEPKSVSPGVMAAAE
jgi:peptidoglycan/LPS O-acetylase OafA/YrhL